ncbi:MAG: DUF349 domain-containing protein [Pseudomonadota bacterium]
MFDFLFKRSSGKPAEPQVDLSAQAAIAASAQAASRRAEQTARAQAVAGDEAAAVAFILSCEFADARLSAAAHVHTQPMLEKVHQAMRNTDRRVAKLMQGRLDLIRHANAEQARAQACLDSARRLLADDKLSPNQVGELDRQWQLIAATPEATAQFDALRADLAARLEEQVRLQRAMIDALRQLRAIAHTTEPAEAAQRVTMEQDLARLADDHARQRGSPERASLPKNLLAEFDLAYAAAADALAQLARHEAAFAARQAALTQWQEADPASLQADSLKRAWNSLPRLSESEPAAGLQQRFEALLAGVTPPPPVREVRVERADRIDRVERVERAAAKAAERPADPQFIEALDGMEAALQQGLLQVASEHDKTLRETKGVRLTAAQSERLNAVRAEFKRLADWARWGGNVSREELVKAAEEMPAQTLAMAELAKKVGSLRERWKSLDTLSGSAPKSLWERFDAACSVAYAPAAAHFKQLAEERHSNAVKARELIAEAGTLAAAPGDWKLVAAALQRLRQAWTRLGPIDRKDKKRLDTEFGEALAALAAPLEQERQMETARREQLIAEVGLLKPNERNTVDMLRALQDKWQELAKALPLERRLEQALWQRFRAACDQVFAQRKESAQAADHERRAHLEAGEALCAGLEQAEIADDSDKRQAAAIATLLREARQAWGALGPVPRAAEHKLEQRFQSALAGLQARADAIAQRAGAAQASALRDKLRLCQELETTLLRDDAGDRSVDWGARWSALPPLEAQFEKALAARFEAARQALEGARAPYAATLEHNRARLRDEVLRLEIVAGVDSGAEFARERLKLQVEVLQSSLKSGQKPVSHAAQLLALAAMPALADERTTSRIEVLLRRIGGGGREQA